MSVADRILLIEDIWDSIIKSKEELPISEHHKNKLDLRLESHKANPTEGKS